MYININSQEPVKKLLLSNFITYILDFVLEVFVSNVRWEDSYF